MNLTLRLVLICLVVLFLFVIFYYLVRKRMNIQYTLGWLGMALIMLIITIFPQIMTFLSRLFGISDETNFLYLLAGAIVVWILLSITSIISKHNETNRRLTQTVALLEKRVRELENENAEKEKNNKAC